MNCPMSTEIGPCRNCGHRVPVTASRCRFCGYDADPEWNERARAVWGIRGLAAVLSIIGIPIGLLLLWKAYQHHRTGTGRVVETAHLPALTP